MVSSLERKTKKCEIIQKHTHKGQKSITINATAIKIWQKKEV